MFIFCLPSIEYKLQEKKVLTCFPQYLNNRQILYGCHRLLANDNNINYEISLKSVYILVLEIGKIIGVNLLINYPLRI